LRRRNQTISNKAEQQMYEMRKFKDNQRASRIAQHGGMKKPQLRLHAGRIHLANACCVDSVLRSACDSIATNAFEIRNYFSGLDATAPTMRPDGKTHDSSNGSADDK
jgi:hypothetical protein